jgi:hypothetical protein
MALVGAVRAATTARVTTAARIVAVSRVARIRGNYGNGEASDQQDCRDHTGTRGDPESRLGHCPSPTEWQTAYRAHSDMIAARG